MYSIKRRLLVLFVFIGLVVFLHFYGFNSHVILQNIQEQAHRLQRFVASYYVISISLYLGIFIAAVFFFLPITVALNLLAGFLCGIWLGALYAVIGATLGSTLLFLLVRYVLGDVVQRRYANQLVRFNHEFALYGHYYLLMLQLFPMTPSFIINICSGLTKISLWTFMWTTAVGVMPGTLVYTMFGYQLQNIATMQDILSWPILIGFIALAVFFLLPMLFRRYIAK